MKGDSGIYWNSDCDDVGNTLAIGSTRQGKTVICLALRLTENYVDEAEIYLEHVYKSQKGSDSKYRSWLQKSGRKDNISNWRLFRMTGGIPKRKNR